MEIDMARKPDPQISLATVRDMIEVIMQYVPIASRANARAAAIAVGVGYEPK
jgi:hypothetical protein